MFGILSLVDLARKIISPSRRQRSRRACVDRQSLRYESLAVEELEDRLMLTMLGQQLFPSDYPWNQNIAGAPVAANSAAIISHIGSSIGIHPDWGEDSATNGTSALYGIPYNVVHGNTTAKINVIIDNYPGESDIVPVPIPSGAVIEGDYQNGPNPNGGGYNSGQRGDSHLLVWDEDTDTAYELYGVTRPSDPTLFPNTNGVELPHTDGLWHAAQETVWHMSTDEFRALGDTSADAAGLSILAGLARPDEGLPTSQGGQGAIDHALRFTLPSGDVAPQYIYPASHVVGESAGATKLPLGARLRLANTPAIDSQISKMGPEAQIIATAMQQYGLVLADIGSSMYVSGTSASQTASNSIGLTWNMNDVLGLDGLTAGDFQVVNLTPVVTGLSANSGSAGNTIVINGQNFSGAAGNLSVFFGTTAATSVTYISDSQISAVVPSGTGTVNVTVQSGVKETDPNNPADNVNAPIFGYGTSAISAADQFSFSGQTIAAPVVTSHQTSVSVTAGATVTVDAPVTVTSADTNVTGAVVTITNASNAFVTGDTLHFTSPTHGVTLVSNTGGVLTLTGTTTPANYALALASITYSNTTNGSTTIRHVSIAVSDSNDTGNVSGSATTQITVNVPITITAAYVSGSAWTTAANTTASNTEQFDTYLVNHSLGDATIPTVGYRLKTGASQTTDLPWVNINTISVSFSGAVSNIGLGSLKLVGGTGGGAVAAPTATGFASDGNNTYSWSFPTALGNNKYIFAIASTGSSFGTLGSTKVTDASGAGISGTFTTGSSTFPSGNGLAGSTFDFAFSVLPGDGKQAGTVNSSDAAAANATLNDHETTAGYSPYYDYYGAGLVNSADGATAAANLNKSQSGITAPAAPSGEQAGATGDAVGTTGFTALELGVQETGSSTSLTAGSSQTSTATTSTAASAGTPSASPTPAATTSASTGGTVGSGSESTTTTTAGQHGRHQFAVTDEAVSDLDLADLWA